MGWNSNSGFMSGMAVHNMVIPFRNFEWCISPMVGIGIRNSTLMEPPSLVALDLGMPWQELLVSKATKYGAGGEYYSSKDTNRLSFEAGEFKSCKLSLVF